MVIRSEGNTCCETGPGEGVFVRITKCLLRNSQMNAQLKSVFFCTFIRMDTQSDVNMIVIKIIMYM